MKRHKIEICKECKLFRGENERVVFCQRRGYQIAIPKHYDDLSTLHYCARDEYDKE